MSYFPDHIIYIIIPTADITYEMENNMKMSYNANQNTIKRNDIDSKRLFKLKVPINDVFLSYKWYSHAEIIEELKETEWL